MGRVWYDAVVVLQGERGQEVKVCYLKDRAGHVTLPTAWLQATGAMQEQRNTFCYILHSFHC